MTFMFEHLEVYQKSVNFADCLLGLTETFTKGYRFLVDQLNRAIDGGGKMNRRWQLVAASAVVVFCFRQCWGVSAERWASDVPRPASPPAATRPVRPPERHEMRLVMDQEEVAPHGPGPAGLEDLDASLGPGGPLKPSGLWGRSVDLRGRVVYLTWTGRSRIRQLAENRFQVTLFGPDGTGVPALFARQGLDFVRGARAGFIWRTSNTPRGFLRGVRYVRRGTRDYVLIAPAAYAMVETATVVDLQGREQEGPVAQLLGTTRPGPGPRYYW